MSRITAVIMLAILLLSSLAVNFNAAKAATVLPPGFVSEVVVNNLTGPTTIAFAPDGRMFIAQKDGQVRVFQNGTLLAANFIDISAEVNTYWDRGLLGIAIHPDFPNTPYVYLIYVYDPAGSTDNGGGERVSRLIRVTADPDNTNIALPGSEVVLLGTNSTFANIGNPANGDVGQPPSCESGGVYVQNCIAADGPSHAIGMLTFGTDGSLFVSSGDGAQFTAADPRALRALSVDSLNGKILRINPITGAGYPNNPFYNGNPNSNRSKVYSLGLRNPFRTTINTLTNELFIGDVGWASWEEIDTGRGKNFGWPCYEGSNIGSTEQDSYKNNAATSAACSALYAQGLGAVQAPLHSYQHTQGGDGAVIIGEFYQGTTYPSQYQNALFFSDYNADSIRYLTFDGNGDATASGFGTDVSPLGGLVQLLVGPDTNLYYVAYNGPTPNTSEVRRIRYTSGGNTPPTANASANPDSGYVPLTVNFLSLGSFDPDVQTLTYLWDFDDGTTSTNPNPSHTYVTNGTFTARLTITDSQGATGSDSVSITAGNLKPTATIILPTNGFAYSTGDIINYSGTGVDNEDGNLSGASLQWDILLHHNQHVHFDYLPGLIGKTGNFPVPDHGDNTWIELCLTVTDSGGLNDQDCVNLQPNTVTLSFDTIPSGLELEYNGIAYTTPFNVITNVNSIRDLIAPLTQQGRYNFTSWSDGGAATHQITTGTAPQTYIATYRNIEVYIGGSKQGGYLLAASESKRVSYAGVDSGPVVVKGTDTMPIISALREVYQVDGAIVSFAQLMGLPEPLLSDKYVFPAYNNVTLDGQLRFGNVGVSDTTVTVTIGGNFMGSYLLHPSESKRVNYVGVDSGLVVVESSGAVPIIAALREAYKVNGKIESFVQLMGLPEPLLSDKYVFPAYNNVTLDGQLRFGNVGVADTTVTVTIGGNFMGSYLLHPSESKRVNYAGVDSGPVVVESSGGVPIIAALRDVYLVGGQIESFAQLMGLPEPQLSDKYVFPAYNNVTLDGQLRFGNVGVADTTVTVTIGGNFMGSYLLHPSESKRVNYPGVDSGPVVVESSGGVPIIAALRDVYIVNSRIESFVQLMGLPDGQLADTYLFPAYNNVTLDGQLRFGVP